MRTRHHCFNCGYILPRILLLWALVDVGLRFGPPGWYSFRVHELALVTGSRSLGPLRTNLTYHNPRAYGDLAELSNCLECRQHRRMDIHIDEQGFANPTSSGRYNAILVGDSFGIGAEQDGSERLTSQISQLTGLSIYNACSPVKAISRKDLMTLLDRVAVARGIVFFELMDWSLGFYGVAQTEPGFNGYERWSKDLEYSPLANISRELVGQLYNGRVMPNPYVSNVVRKNLPDGRPILFQLDDVRNSTPDGPKLWARYFRTLNQELQARHFKLIVILVPSKYTAYQPLIAGANPTNKSEQFEELRRELPDIPVVDTTPALQQAAADAFNHGHLLYWLDDTHWNGDGVRIAARRVAAVYSAQRTIDKTSLESIPQPSIRQIKSPA